MEKPPSYDPTIHTNRLIRSIVEHTHHEFGEQYFKLLVKHLALALEVSGAWVTEYAEKEDKLKSFAFWNKDHYVDHYEYLLKGTPCERVVNSQECFLVPEKVVELFPDDPDLKPLNAVSYMGYPLFDKKKKVVGHIAILHHEPLTPTKEQEAIFELFVQRANAEFLRLKAENQLLDRELRLSSLVNGVHDAIVEIDEFGFVTLINPAAIKIFGLTREQCVGMLVFGLFDNESNAFLRNYLKEVREKADPDDIVRYEFQCLGSNGESIPAEGSICSYTVKENLFVTLILRDMQDLKKAHRRIEIMEEKIGFTSANPAQGIVGESKIIKNVIEELTQVAMSNSTILLLGESGTGKEVFAKYVHEVSPRKDKPLVKVNCAAIPSNLIESEFFGHEKGAFTGAVSRREGRFSLADGGTLFLDEVGELPIEMQPKLLRVLQEGEFETVGGQRTIKVNVRIVAATNRNLQEMVKAGTFREDLFYRLNVIPVTLPPLRERGDDILLLAEVFIKKFSRQIGKRIYPISAACARQLLDYPWPGNIRELEHVIERGVILSKDGQLDLERFIPLPLTSYQPGILNDAFTSDDKVLTVSEIENLERKNILKALTICSWKISGPNGAAQLLGIPPSTLNSKIKVLNIIKTHGTIEFS
jgi:PAS domain S-box-containing protein